MGDLELSLEEIIKKKLVKTGTNRGRINAPNNRKPINTVKRLSDQSNRGMKSLNIVNNNKSFVKSRPGVLKSARGHVQPTVGDARMKIIQKQRQKITDAREKLGQIAKQTDARVRLEKLRERQRVLGGRIGQAVRGIPEEQLLQRTIRGAVANPTFDDELMDFNDEVAYMARNFSERAIIDADMYDYNLRARTDTPILYRTIENDLPPSRLFNQEKNLYSWTNPRLGAGDMPDIPVKRAIGRSLLFGRSEDRSDSPSWDFDDPPIIITKKVKPTETVGILKRSAVDSDAVRIIKESSPAIKSRGSVRTLSDRFCKDGNPSAQKINQLKARLEASQLTKKNSGSRTDALTPVGHRIVVSNLVPSVTHEDVKELFEDIGELMSSKVVRPGTAEVVYKSHKDAVKAVDVYHNRQLDGQPMKCLLVNNKSALPISSKATKDRKIVELDMTAFRKALHKKMTS